jgi:ATP-dependent DNA helicase RecG
MLSEADLLALLRAPEGDRVERKASAADRGELMKAICAFANDLAGHGLPGVILIGVHDDGRCAGLAVDEALLREIGDRARSGTIQPLPSLTVQRRVLDGCTLAVVEVAPSDSPPVRYDGRCWVRIGPRKAQASAQDERRLVEKRRWGALPFDQQPVPGATLDDLDLVRFRLEYLPSFVPPDVLEANDRREADQLSSLRLLARDGAPTAAAILLLGKDPQAWLPSAYVQFVRFDGTALTDAVKDRKEIGGTLIDQLRELDDVLAAHVATAIDTTGPREARHPDYPIVALRELARNAIIHRAYEGASAPVHLYWYKDRIEIASPGGPYGEVTVETFGQPGVVAYRNPAIAEAAARLGFAQRFGRGIALARAELARNGNPPLGLTVLPDRVLVTIRPRA